MFGYKILTEHSRSLRPLDGGGRLYSFKNLFLSFSFCPSVTVQLFYMKQLFTTMFSLILIYQLIKEEITYVSEGFEKVKIPI